MERYARKYNTGRSLLVQGFLVVIAMGTQPRNDVLDDVVRYCIGHTNSGNGDIHEYIIMNHIDDHCSRDGR